jgi:hypothetical protein
MKAFALALFYALEVSAPAFGEDTPQTFLAEVLAHDFDGDGAFRVGKAIFTDGLPARVGDECCSEPREVFDAKSDPIELVVKWDFAAAGKVTPQEATVPVHFTAVAETIGFGDSDHNPRRVKPLAAPRDVTVTYHLQHRGADWVMVNPPLPRVSLFALIHILRDNIQETEEIIKAHATEPNVVRFQERMIAIRNARASELENIAHKMNLSPEAETGQTK